MLVWFFFFKQKTAYEVRISDWSSDVCSSDLSATPRRNWQEGIPRSASAPASGCARDRWQAAATTGNSGRFRDPGPASGAAGRQFPRLPRAPNAPSAINCDRRPRSRLWRVSGADTGSPRRRAAGSVRGWCMCGRTWCGRLSKASRVDCGARSSYATGASVRNYDLDFLKHFSMVIGFLAVVTLALLVLSNHINGVIPPEVSPTAARATQARDRKSTRLNSSH